MHNFDSLVFIFALKNSFLNNVTGKLVITQLFDQLTF